MKLGNINKFGGDLSKVVGKLGDTVQVCVCVCVCVCVIKSSLMPFRLPRCWSTAL